MNPVSAIDLLVAFPQDKVCSKCRIAYPASVQYFYSTGKRKKKNGSLRFYSWCKQCMSENDRIRYYASIGISDSEIPAKQSYSFPQKLPFEERFWLKVEKTESCWLWTGDTNFGYGRLKHKGKMLRAHRVAWSLTHGDIPDGLVICHICDNRNCVRPSHLEVGTMADNVTDMIAKNRGHWQQRKPILPYLKPIKKTGIFRIQSTEG